MWYLKNTKPVIGNAAGAYFVKNSDNPSENGLYIISTTGTEPVNMSNENGTSYVLVYATGTPKQNAIEFTNAYNSIDSGTLIFAPGTYEFPTPFIHNKDGVNIVSLTGNRDGIFTVKTGDTAIRVFSTNSIVKGINTLNKRFQVFSGTENLIIEKCKGGDNSFGQNEDLIGTFIDCEAGNNSFGIGDGETISCTFIRCKAGTNSFGVDCYIDGKFVDCEAGDYSFGVGLNAVIWNNAEFIRCKAGTNSFGFGVSTHGANYYYCIGGAGSEIASTTGVKLFCAVNNVAV